MRRTKIIITILLILFTSFSLSAVSNSNTEYKKPHFAITGYYDFVSKLWSRGSIYGLFEHVGIYGSFASFYPSFASSNICYGFVDSTGKVDLWMSYRPTDAKNHNSYYLLSSGIDTYSQFGYAFGGVLRIGKHFNISIGIGQNKINAYKWGTIKYPSTNILGQNYIYMPSNGYLIVKDLQDVWATWWEFGCLITTKRVSFDMFITYTPLINKTGFSMGIGGAY